MSADPLGEGHDDPLGPADVRHPPDVLVPADTADQPVTVGGQPLDGGVQVVDLEGHVAQPQLVGQRGRRAGYVIRSDEARQLEPGAAVGGRSMTISVRESGMPITVSRKSPSTNIRDPSISRPSPTKKSVTTSRSATVIPMWSKRRIEAMPPSCTAARFRRHHLLPVRTTSSRSHHM